MNTPPPAVIGAIELRELLNYFAPQRLIDVRTPGEFATSHIAGAHNVPLDLLHEHRDEIRRRLDTDVVLICRSGQRAAQAEVALRSAGLVDVHVLSGGVSAWEASAVLGSVAAPKLKWLAAAIGGGLAFAAVSNTCAMGMLLAKLTYNRGAARDLDSIIAALVEHPPSRMAG